MSLKIKKCIFGKVSLCVGIVVVLLLGAYMWFNSLSQNNSRVPASYTLHTSEIESRSKEMMEKSRRLHVIEDYQSANSILSELLDKYPYTTYTEEASFLLAKGFWYEEQYHESERVIQILQEYAPDSRSKWMGYSLLVMGKIREERGQAEEAASLYRTIISEFSDGELINEAEDLLLNITL